MNAPTVVCVLGMHRSGTSLAAGFLGNLGLYLGSERSMMVPAADNPKGFWELDPIRDLNDDIFAAFGGAWDRPPDLPRRWERSRRVAALRDRARELVHEEFGGRERWAWKDPRTSLTLPLWRRVAPPMRYVVCVRSPLEVARSLEWRNGIPVERGSDLWLAYTASALRNTAGQERMLVAFDELLGDWRAAAERLASFAGVSIGGDAERRIEDFVSGELRHHASEPGEALRSPEVRPHAKALYGALEAALDAQRLGTPDPAVDEALETLARPT